MKKYFLRAINLSNYYSMNNLGYYYKNTEKNNTLALKYYLLAIHHNYNKKVDLSFSIDVPITPNVIENIDENDNFPVYINSYISLYKHLQKVITEKIDLIELPFKYAPNESGFQEAKKDFMKEWNLK